MKPYSLACAAKNPPELSFEFSPNLAEPWETQRKMPAVDRSKSRLAAIQRDLQSSRLPPQRFHLVSDC